MGCVNIVIAVEVMLKIFFYYYLSNCNIKLIEVENVKKTVKSSYFNGFRLDEYIQWAKWSHWNESMSAIDLFALFCTNVTNFNFFSSLNFFSFINCSLIYQKVKFKKVTHTDGSLVITPCFIFSPWSVQLWKPQGCSERDFIFWILWC